MFKLIRTPEFWIVTFSMIIWFSVLRVGVNKRAEKIWLRCMCARVCMVKWGNLWGRKKNNVRISRIKLQEWKQQTTTSNNIQNMRTQYTLKTSKEWMCYHIFIFNTASAFLSCSHSLSLSHLSLAVCLSSSLSLFFYLGKMRKKTRIRALKVNRWLRVCPF